MKTDATLDLDEGVTLDAEVVAGFQRDGCAFVPGLLGRERAEQFRQVVEPLAVKHAWNKEHIPGDGNLSTLFLQTFNLWRLSPEMEAFVLSRRFAGVAAQLLGVERVRLYHDQSLCKGPGGGRTPWHQDHYYWPLDTDAMVTMWMPLVDLTDDVGSMTFAQGSHRFGDLCGTGISRESNTKLEEVIAERAFPTHTYGAMRAGDATFHHGWTVHSADRNRTDALRTVMTVIYYADGAKVADELTPAQEVDRVAWVGGRTPGEVADHELNPVLG